MRRPTLALLTALPLLAQADPSPLQRATAARLTAEKSAACVAAQPFYWEIGNATQPLAGGKAGEGGPERRTEMAIASASKWLYGAFVAERRQGQLTAEDVKFLHFQSGYTYYHVCRRDQSVAACQDSLINGRGRKNPATENRFDYNGGHMQQHAVLMGLGSFGPDGLALAVKQALAPALGDDWRLSYSQAMPAGGGVTSAAEYSRFLRGLLDGRLQLGRLLGSQAVCTNPQVCPNEAVKTPIPGNESWHYSLGHWVEDDPQVGDGAFSSPGAFGFYPWISADRRLYGIVAREQRNGVLGGDGQEKPAVASVDCGREIRAAWMDGEPRR
ncbi:hypothetical protein [Roseateles sp.]|uniref:hypothetical protein n=1 Tax=Roseateles sp. TaxID=1971397 RepID=UPI002DF9045F|nr:hypothetical protein [Roseateles sp.]